MKISSSSRIAQLATAIIVVPILLWANSGGPPVKHSGAPGDTPNSCAAGGCHVGTAVNGGGGRVELVLPGGLTYTPGVKQKIEVKITQPEATSIFRYGYQASARLASNEARGQAGRFTALGTDIVLCEDSMERKDQANDTCRSSAPLEFVEHGASSTSSTMAFEWTPPATDVGDIKIYVAGNAANGNRSNSGDRIYTANITLKPAGAAVTKPAISSGGVTNGASGSAGIVSGSWVSIYGERLATTTKDWTGLIAANGTFPTSIDGVSVRINDQPASVYFISPGQINVQAPTLTATGPVSVTVTNSAGTSDTFTANVLREQPGLFLFTQAPKKYPAAVRADGVFIGPAGLFGAGTTTVPAKPGDTILLFGTGFGPTNPAVPAGSVFSGAAPLVDIANLRISIGGISVTPTFAGLSGSGLYQFNVLIPAAAANGDQPLTMTINGQAIQSDVLLSIQR